MAYTPLEITFVIISFVFMIIGIVLASEYSYLNKVTGTVIENYTASGSTQYTYKISYTVNTKEYLSLVNTKQSHHLQDEVTVYYLSTNPSFVLENPSLTIFYIGIAFSCMPLLPLIYIIINRLLNKEPPEPKVIEIPYGAEVVYAPPPKSKFPVPINSPKPTR